MKVEWLDVLKLTVPFATAVMMVWIKAWIEAYLSRKNKQHAITRLLNDELHGLPEAVRAFFRIAEDATKGDLRLVSFDVPSLISKFACELADLDSKQAYCYADLASSIEPVNKGSSRLSSLVVSRTGIKDNETNSLLDRAIHGQSKITATDYVSFGKAALKVMEAIPEGRRYVDAQAFGRLRDAVTVAGNSVMEWPNITGR